MDNSNSGKVSKNDVISVIALLLLAVMVFFGMNFLMLGNYISSLIISILLFVLMTFFVFFASFAKAQNRNQSTWKTIGYSLIALYVAALIPCYMGVSKFLDIQFDKGDKNEGLQADIRKDIEDIDSMFMDFETVSERRCKSFRTELESLCNHKEGREEIIELFEFEGKNQSEITKDDVDILTESFRKTIMKDFTSLKKEKDALVAKCTYNLDSWNLLYLPQYVVELSYAKENYADRLSTIAKESKKNPLEYNVPSFDVQKYNTKTNVLERFTNWKKFSFWGLLITVFLAFLGLFKYAFGQKSDIVPFKEGTASVITEDGGYTF